MSIRADVITRRTYCRPLDEAGTKFESWQQVVERVIRHQRWLWERALTHKENPDVNLHDINEWENTDKWVRLDKSQQAELDELMVLLFNKKVAVSGRNLWLGGTPIGKNIEASQFNCAALDIQTVYDMVDAFWLLLNGAGVGFRPVAGNLTGFHTPIKNLKVIRSRGSVEKGRETNLETWDSTTKTWTISVGDSAIAWAKFIGKLLAGDHRADTLVLDFSEIRKEGLRLRQYGWISQGDKGLASASEKIFYLLNRRADSLLTAIDILDVVNLLGTVLSTRRSAQIAIYNYEDPEWEQFIAAKNNIFENGKQHRSQSNNSIMFKRKPTIDVLHNLFDQINEGGRGEPGIINGETMARRSPWATLTNPCITGDTLVSTSNGLQQAKDLVDVPFRVAYNGIEVPSTGFFVTGTKKVYLLELEHGYSVKATADHKILAADGSWVPLLDLSIGTYIQLDVGAETNVTDIEEFDKGWLLGEVVGDGGHNPEKYASYVRFWGDSAKAMYDKAFNIVEKLPKNYHQPVPLNANKKDNEGVHTLSSKAITDFVSKYLKPSSKDFIETEFIKESDSFLRGFISGFFDADGSVQGNLQKGVSIRLSQANLGKLKFVQILLARLGIVSNIYQERQPAGKRSMPDGKGGSKDYDCKATHELVVSKASFDIFTSTIGFYEPEKQFRAEAIVSARKRKAYKDKLCSRVASITELGEEVVYDCQVPGINRFVANGIVVHNCGEILLPPSGGFCCLTSLNLGAFKGNILELLRAAKIITRANYRQTVVDFRDGILQEKWHLNNEHLHLCGVSLMGVAEVPEMTYYEYARLERTITAAGYAMAKELDKPYPKQLSTCKPEGTQSKCYDTTEGVHTPLGKYILNNVAFSIHDPLVELLREANYKVFNHPYDSSAVLATMPVKYDNVKFSHVDGKEVNLETAIDQLERYKMLMQSYCHQNVSCTISYDKHETDDIVNWLYNNWDNYVAVSFLFRNDPTKTAADLGYPYLPQEVVTKEVWEAYNSKLKYVDLDAANSSEELMDQSCATGACPVR